MIFAGSGLSEKQRLLVITVMLLLVYVALGSMAFSFMLELTCKWRSSSPRADYVGLIAQTRAIPFVLTSLTATKLASHYEHVLYTRDDHFDWIWRRRTVHSRLTDILIFLRHGRTNSRRSHDRYRTRNGDRRLRKVVSKATGSIGSTSAGEKD